LSVASYRPISKTSISAASANPIAMNKNGNPPAVLATFRAVIGDGVRDGDGDGFRGPTLVTLRELSGN
jgi:hypothetical protein